MAVLTFRNPFHYNLYYKINSKKRFYNVSANYLFEYPKTTYMVCEIYLNLY